MGTKMKTGSNISEFTHLSAAYRRQVLEESVVIAVGSAILAVLGVLFGILFFTNDVQERERITAPRKILVVAPHEDDEMVIAGGRMIANQQLGGENWVVYLTTGASIFRSPALNRIYYHQRRREAVEAMRTIGVPKERLIFLGRPAQHYIKHPDEVESAIKSLADIIARIRPDEIFTAAYEGGHCIHDLANFITFRAIQRADWKGKFYESTEYNPFLSYLTPQKIIKVLLEAILAAEPSHPVINVEPRFIPDHTANLKRHTPVIQIRLSRRQLSLKRTALKQYRTQNFKGDLVKKFAFPEKYRLYPGHNYCAPPLAFRASWNFCAAKKLNNLPPGKNNYEAVYSVCRITLKTFLSTLPEKECKDGLSN
ncbi:MAG: PIG-L family deacetylase [bacterium]